MTTLNLVETNDLGNEFDIGVIEPSKIHVKLDGTTVVRDAITGVISSPQVNPLNQLPEPKIKLLASNGTTGLMMDGNPIPVKSIIQVTLNGIPDIFITNPAYDLGLEMVRRKTRARTHKQKNSRNSIVHSANIVGGLPSPVLIHGTKGGVTNIGYSLPNRPTEWSLAGLGHNAAITLQPEAITGWFYYGQVYSVFGPSYQYLRYLDGRSRSSSNFWSANALFNLGNYNVTGVFYLRYSILDPVSDRRLYGPLSSQIIAEQQIPISVPIWATGTTPFNLRSKDINPNFVADGTGPLNIRIGNRADSPI